MDMSSLPSQEGKKVKVKVGMDRKEGDSRTRGAHAM